MSMMSPWSNISPWALYNLFGGGQSAFGGPIGQSTLGGQSMPPPQTPPPAPSPPVTAPPSPQAPPPTPAVPSAPTPSPAPPPTVGGPSGAPAPAPSNIGQIVPFSALGLNPALVNSWAAQGLSYNPNLSWQQAMQYGGIPMSMLQGPGPGMGGGGGGPMGIGGPASPVEKGPSIGGPGGNIGPGGDNPSP